MTRPAGTFQDAVIDFGDSDDGAKINREPFALRHNLSALDLFSPSFLRDLTERYGDHHFDYFVAGAAPAPGTEFYSVPSGRYRPDQAIGRLNDEPVRILLKRPETYHPLFRDLLDHLFAQVVARMGGLGGARVERLESAIFLTSAESITPFHFDPELNFFFQVSGEKTYHVFSPSVLAEPELERFYRRNEINIGQVDLPGRDAAREHVFDLAPGRGLHQPQDAPHWARTGKDVSISYSFVLETSATRARNRVRAFNHYLRKAGLSPVAPNRQPQIDIVKASAMTGLFRLRQSLRDIRRRIS